MTDDKDLRKQEREESSAIAVVVQLSIIGTKPDLLDDSSLSPLRHIQLERYIALADTGMKLYVEQRDNIPLFQGLDEGDIRRGYQVVKERLQ